MDGDLKIQFDDDGNLLYEREGPTPIIQMAGPHFLNLATQMRSDDLDLISTSLTTLVSEDEHSREDWEKINADNYELLGVGPESEPDLVDETYGDTSDHPLLLTALVRYMSKATAVMLPVDHELCRYDVAFDQYEIKDPKERRARLQDAHNAGARVTAFYTDYLKNKVPGYIEDTDQILLECGLNGLGVRKIYDDNSRPNAPVQLSYVSSSDIIISYDSKNFRCGRIAHRMHITTPDMVRMIMSGQYRSVDNLHDGDIPDKGVVEEQKDRIHGISHHQLQGTETHKVYEIHCDLFLAEDAHPMGYARPYIVTVHAATRQVLSIVRNWRPSDPDEARIEHFVGYLLHPGKSAVYGMGLGQILSNITRALRRAQRRGLEAAYLQNHPSGFKLSNFKVRDDATKIRNGEFIDVDSPTGDIRSALMMHVFEGPSQGLAALADKMESNGKQLGGMATQDLENLMKAGMAAGPAMAAYEEATEFQSSIHARLYRAQATELKLLHERMREKVGNQPMAFGMSRVLHPGDLMKVDLLPYMKPGQASKQKTVLEAEAVLGLADRLPGIIDKRKAGLDYLRALGKTNIDDIMIPDPEDNPPEPADAISEYQKILGGMPVKAGFNQNHQAHIDTHAAQMRELQESHLPVEKGEAALAVLSAHIAEHMSQMQLVEVARRIGVPVEQLMDMSPEVEYRIAPMVAEAVSQIEAERRAGRGEESRIEIEKVKGENDLRIETMRQEHKERMQTMQQAHEKDLQKMRDTAAMDRALQDDETAMEIASMTDRNTAPGRAGTEAR